MGGAERTRELRVDEDVVIMAPLGEGVVSADKNQTKTEMSHRQFRSKSTLAGEIAGKKFASDSTFSQSMLFHNMNATGETSELKSGSGLGLHLPALRGSIGSMQS